MMIGEIGSTEYGGSKAAWIKDMLAKIPTSYPKIRGLLWFEQIRRRHGLADRDLGSATGAFAAGIQNPAYAGNTFGSPAAAARSSPPAEPSRRSAQAPSSTNVQRSCRALNSV